MFQDLSHDDYLAYPAMSNSGIGRILRSPAHYRAYLSEPQKETPALIAGRILHSAILEPEKFLKQYAAQPKGDMRTKDGKAAKEKWDTDNPDVIGIGQDDYDRYRRIVDAVHAHPSVDFLLADGIAEQSGITNDPETGAPVKFRPDWMMRGQNIMADFKSTEDASPAFQRSAFNYGYHRQAAFYTDATEWLGEKRPDGFVFVAFEKEPPFGVMVYEPDAHFIDKGREAYRKGLNLYAECLRTDQWPAYPTEVQTLSLPAWAG